MADATKTRSGLSRRLKGVLLLIIIAGCGTVGILAWKKYSTPTYQPPAMTFDGASTDLKNTVIVPTLDTPLPAGKNVIWCSSFQIAWNHMRDDVIKAPILVANAQPIADRLNTAPQSEKDLPAGSFYAVAGRVQDGIVQTILSEVAKRFPAAPKPDLGAVGPESLLAYAYLQAGVKFTIPFFDNDEDFTFTDSAGNQTKVRSFGLRRKDFSKYWKLRGQVKVLYATNRMPHGTETQATQQREFALDLCKDSAPNRIMLACVTPGETLQATLASLEQKIAQSASTQKHEHTLGSSDTLLVPTAWWRVKHDFAEIEGTDKLIGNPGFQGYWIDRAFQMIDFTLDRSGAELKSEAVIVARSASAEQPCHFDFDRPFLIVMSQRGAAQPFFVMWVDNAELLTQ